MKTKNINNRILMVLTLLLVMGAQLATAQMGGGMNNKTPEEKAQAQTQFMKMKLNLDSAQVTSVKAINLKYAIKTDPIMKSDDKKFAKFKEMRTIQKDKDSELKKVLTAEQFKQYEDLKAEVKEEVKEKMKEKKQQ